jgi:hypothetical protein
MSASRAAIAAWPAAASTAPGSLWLPFRSKGPDPEGFRKPSGSSTNVSLQILSLPACRVGCRRSPLRVRCRASAATYHQSIRFPGIRLRPVFSHAIFESIYNVFMPEYRRSLIEGGTYFFTGVVYRRLPIFSNPLARKL